MGPGLDSWHKIIFAAIAAVFTAMTGAMAAMWRREIRRSREVEQMHEDARADVKELTNRVIELAQVATYAQPLKRLPSQPPGSKE